MPPQRLSADGVFARRPGDAASVEVLRQDLVQPSEDERKTSRTLYASAAYLVGIEITLRSGTMRVTAAGCLVDAGKVLHEQPLLGPWEAAIAQTHGTKVRVVARAPCAVPLAAAGWGGEAR